MNGIVVGFGIVELGEWVCTCEDQRRRSKKVIMFEGPKETRFLTFIRILIVDTANISIPHSNALLMQFSLYSFPSPLRILGRFIMNL